MEYTVYPVTSPEDQAQIEEFVHDHFVPVMPLILAFGLQDSPPQRPPQQPRPEDFTLQARDSNGDIIGAAINKFNPTFCLQPTSASTAEAVKNMTDFMNYVEKEALLDELPERTMELRVLSVREDWRNRGVARRLAEESMRVAKEAGFTCMRVCCTSEYTAKLARSLQWIELIRIAYKECPKLLGRNVQIIPTPPHDFLYYYYTNL